MSAGSAPFVGGDLAPRMRAWGLPLKAQGPRGTCSVFAITAAIEYAVARRNACGAPLSEQFLNWAAHQASGEAGDGGFFSDIWAGFQAYGVCAQALAPYSETYDPDYRPTTEALRQAAALRGKPKFADARFISFPNPQRIDLTQQQRGRHVKCLVQTPPRSL